MRLVILLIITLGLHASALAEQWEYRMAKLYSHCEEQQLAALGTQGWELVAPIRRADDKVEGIDYNTFIFKAPLGKGQRPKADLNTVLDWFNTARDMSKATGKTRFTFGAKNGEPMIYLKKSDLDGFLKDGLCNLATAVWEKPIRICDRDSDEQIGELSSK